MCTAVFVINPAALVLAYSRAPIKTVCVDVYVKERMRVHVCECVCVCTDVYRSLCSQCGDAGARI